MHRNWKNQFTECENYEKHICAACDSTTTYIQDGYEIWRYHDGHWMCKKCYQKYVSNPNTIVKHTPRQLSFRDTRLYVKDPPRKGVCEWCGKKVGDEYIGCRGKKLIVKATLIHHLEYHDEDVLKDTVELCVSCHMKHHVGERYRGNMHIR